MKGGSLAIVGLAIGVAGVLLAMVVRSRWARPVGAILLVVAVLAEVAAVQAGPKASGGGGGGGGHTTPPTFQTAPPGSPPVTPSGTHSFSAPPATPQLLSQIHPGIDPITKLIVVNKEFVRLTNTGTRDAHIGGWVLSNGTFSFTFPVGAVVPHGQSLVVRSGAGTNVPGTVHMNLTHYVWPKTGGKAILKDGSGHVVQTCQYQPVTTDDPSASC